MPVQLVRPREAAAASARWTCALVNNMPDSAFAATQQQYIDLLDAASGAETISVRLHTLDGVPRGETVASLIAEEYSPPSQIRSDRPDMLIVTGSNPLESHIEDEPYWGELSELLLWGRGQVATMLLSCLAAHAAGVVLDGLRRQAMPTKCTGVFAEVADSTQPLAAELDPPLILPHSRLNTIDVGDLTAAGYRVTLGSDEVGWSVATKIHEGTEVVLIQGHPEYGPNSLLREYQRDVRRYVRSERDELPCLPVDCVGPEDWGALTELAARIESGERDPGMVDAFDFEGAGTRAPWPWRTMAIGLYKNWLAGVPKRSD